ncbi:MAG: hypothetical protein NXI31_10755 [bacterium]|nr:hypothetical protein [bacterium]
MPEASSREPLATLVAEGLVPVPEAALRAVGFAINRRTARAYSLHGKNGVRLEVVIGKRGQRMTSVAEFRRFWVAATAPHSEDAA